MESIDEGSSSYGHSDSDEECPDTSPKERKMFSDTPMDAVSTGTDVDESSSDEVIPMTPPKKKKSFTPHSSQVQISTNDSTSDTPVRTRTFTNVAHNETSNNALHILIFEIFRYFTALPTDVAEKS